MVKDGVTLNGAGKRLGIPNQRVRGYAEALGVRLTRAAGRTIVMSEADFQRIAKLVRRVEPVPEPAAAS